MNDRYTSFRTVEVTPPERGVLRVTLRDRFPPDERYFELADMWRSVEHDADVRAVIFRTTDAEIADPAAEFTSANTQSFVRAMLGCHKPVVAAVDGQCSGVALTIAVLSDVSLVAAEATIVPGRDMGEVDAVWPLLCGMAKAKYHLMLSEPLDGREAERIGLMSECVARRQLDARSNALASRLAQSSAYALSHTKFALNGWLGSRGPMLAAAMSQTESQS